MEWKTDWNGTWNEFGKYLHFTLPKEVSAATWRYLPFRDPKVILDANSNSLPIQANKKQLCY